ncbi:MAG: hypothetical protein PHC90_13210, partial [Syntrophorhabdaceae bacterium]|nr:hypothetical protein [Syntrophorhabdaceae bacterium]
QLSRYLNNSSIDLAKDIASALNSLREVRNDADYNLQTRNFDALNCKLHCTKAENSLGRFDNVDLTKLVDNIRSYARSVREPGI